MTNKKDLTSYQRQKASREKRKAAGLKRKELWLPESVWKQVKALINKLKEGK